MAVLLGRIEREQFASRAAVESPRACNRRVPPSTRIAQLSAWSFVDDVLHATCCSADRRAPAAAGQVAVCDRPWHASERSGDCRVAAGSRRDRSAVGAGDLRLRAPGRSFSGIDDGGPLFDGSGVGHPLLDERMGVRNDVRLGRAASAGADRQRLEHVRARARLLRAVGVNVVLALAGAPVRATELTFRGLPSARRSEWTTRFRRATRASTPRFSASAIDCGARATSGVCAVSARRDSRRNQFARSAHRGRGDRRCARRARVRSD